MPSNITTANEKIQEAVGTLRRAVIAAELRECADYIESKSSSEKWTVQGVVEMLRHRAELME